MALTVTRADLKEYAIQAIHGGAVDTVAVDRVERGIENALDLLSNHRRFSWQQNVYDLVSVAPYATGTVDTISTTTVNLSGSTLPSDIVGQFIEIDGERHWYEITTRTSNTAVVVRFAYQGSGTSGDAYKVVYPLINLPGDFGKAIAIFDVENDQWLEEVAFGANWQLHSERAGVGTPDHYSIIAKRNDPNQWQLLLYPAPQAARVYQMVYYRYAGWYDTATPATSTWKRKATADTDYVDWPDKAMYLLEAAVLASVAKEIKPQMYPQYLSDFNMQLQNAANFDRKSAKPMLLSRGTLGGYGQRWDF